MHRDRFRLGRLVAIGALLMTGGCGEPTEAFADPPGLTGGWATAGCEFARFPETDAQGGVTIPVTPAKLDAVMARIEQVGRADHADSYAGLEVDQENVRAIVYRVPSAAFDDFVRGTAEDTCIIVRDAARSAKDLAVWHDRVLADLPYWTHEGIRVVTLNARHDGAGLEIGTRDLDRARSDLPARYGPDAPLILVGADPVFPLSSPSVPPPSTSLTSGPLPPPTTPGT